jgi:DNA-binding FadR family transcriptional regulator
MAKPLVEVSKVRSQAERVASEIEAEILEKGFEDGTFLGRKDDLRTRHHVSPATMNEALRLLRERAIVRVRPGVKGGVEVAITTRPLVVGNVVVYVRDGALKTEDLLDARARLEEMLGQLALERATDDDLKTLDASLDVLRDSRWDPRRWLETTWRLHVAIARAAKNPILEGLYTALIGVLDGAIARVVALDQYPFEIMGHVRIEEEIVEAIRKRDRKRLDEAMRRRRELVRPEKSAPPFLPE